MLKFSGMSSYNIIFYELEKYDVSAFLIKIETMCQDKEKETHAFYVMIGDNEYLPFNLYF